MLEEHTNSAFTIHIHFCSVILITLHRLDNQLLELDEEVRSSESKKEVIKEMYAPEDVMHGLYRSIDTAFCDLNDTSDRTLE